MIILDRDEKEKIMVRKRKDILKDLVSINGNIKELKEELSIYHWDADEPLLVLDKKIFSRVLKKCILEEINFSTLKSWADAIECRDDLDFTDEVLKEKIFELANPEINGMITKEKVIKLFDSLNN